MRTLFRRACRRAAIEGLWFHDLRRSFVTNARRRGIPESVVMRMSGHRTRAVFDRYNIISETDLVRRSVGWKPDSARSSVKIPAKWLTSVRTKKSLAGYLPARPGLLGSGGEI